MKILVTGATGFIGKNCVRRLLAEGHEVVCCGRNFSRFDITSDRVKTVSMELEDREGVRRIFLHEKPDIVYHCAALVSGRSLKKLRSVNVEGTRTVFEASLETGVRRVIYLSTIAVANGNPQIPLTEDLPLKTRSLYGLSKAEAEEVAAAYRKKGLKIAILRPCMVYGEGEPHALSRLAGGVKRRLIPVLGTGDTKLHLVSVENVVDVLALCLSKEEACEGAYFVADNEVLSVREVLDCIADALNAKKPVVLPGYIAVILARIPCIGDRVSFFLRDRVYSIERLKRILGYVPRVSVYDGLKRAVIACRV